MRIFGDLAKRVLQLGWDVFILIHHIQKVSNLWITIYSVLYRIVVMKKKV